jgi:hypothetical protein
MKSRCREKNRSRESAFLFYLLEKIKKVVSPLSSTIKFAIVSSDGCTTGCGCGYLFITTNCSYYQPPVIRLLIE